MMKVNPVETVNSCQADFSPPWLMALALPKSNFWTMHPRVTSAKLTHCIELNLRLNKNWKKKKSEIKSAS